MAIQSVLSSNTFNQFRTTTNLIIANVNSQYDGTANLVLNSANSATVNVTALTVYGDAAIQGGDITTNSASFTLANTTATTLSLGGAATSVLIGSTTGNTNIRSANTVLAGDLYVNGGDILSTATTLNIANTTATTLSVGGDATALLLGANTGTTTIRNASTVLYGDLAVNGGDITTSATTFNVGNTTATIVNIGGVANVNIGSTTGNTTISSANTVLSGDLFVNGGDILTTAATFTLANSTATLLELGGAANVNIGSTTGNTNIRSANTVLSGDLFVNGGDILSTQTTFNIANTTATTLSIGGAATSLLIGATTGNTTIRNPVVTSSTFESKDSAFLASTLAGDAAYIGTSGKRVIINGGANNNHIRGELYGGTFSIYQNGQYANGITIEADGTVNVSSTLDSTSTTTGALKVSGGFGVVGNAYLGSDLAVNGGDITTNSTSFTLANTTATTLWLGSAANVLIGSTTGNTTIRSANTVLTGDLFVNGGDIFTTNTVFSIANNTATTVWLGGGATSNVVVGATTGNTTLRSADTTVDGKLTVKGITNIGVNTTTDALRVTQDGSGNALVIQDVSSDTTSFVIDATGRVIMGGTQYQSNWYASSVTVSNFITGNTGNGDGLGIVTYGNTPHILMGRHGANTLNTRGTVANGDELGAINFAGDANLGGGLSKGALIQAVVDSVVDTANTTTIPTTISIRTKTTGATTPAATATFDSSGNTTLSTNLAVNGSNITTSNATFSIANTNATTLSVGGGATALLIGATTGNTTIRNAGTVITGDLFVSGGDIVGTTATLNLANETTTTLNLGGAATALTIGATTGNTTIRNSGTVIAGDLFVQGGDIVATTATANLANSTTTTLNIGGAANVITVGANTGSLTINNDKVIINSTGALRVPSGNTAQRGTAARGDIRYSTELSAYEGYDGSNWSSLGGVKSVDGLTYIIAETSPGASDDTLHFYTANGATSYEVAQMNATKLAILQNTASSNATTGALTVAGGVGINGALYVNQASTISSNLTVTGNTAINGGGITTTNTIFTVANSTATLLELGGAANVNIGSAAGNTVIRSANTFVNGVLNVQSGSIVSNQASFNIANTTATTLWLGGTANVNIGSNTGTTTIRNANTVVEGILESRTATYLANTYSGNALYVGTIGGRVIVNAGAQDNYIRGEYATGNFSIYQNGTTANGITISGDGAVNVNSTLGSTSTTSGALRVAGGLGVVGNTNIGGDIVLMGSNITTGNSTFTVANTTATTVNIGGAANVNIGSTTGTTTLRSASVNILGSAITTSNTSFAVANTNATTLWLGGAANVNIGSSAANTTTIINSANTTIAGNTIITGNLTVNGNTTTINSTTLSVDDKNIVLADGAIDNAAANGAGITIAGSNANVVYLSASDSFSLNKNIIAELDLAVNGGDITTTSTTFTVANATATTLELGGAANVNFGSATGNTIIRSANTFVNGFLNVQSGNIVSNQASFNIANTTATTLGIGGAATTVWIGATTGTTTIRNPVVTSSTFESKGVGNILTGTTGDGLYVGLAGSRLILNASGANNTIKGEFAGAWLNLVGSTSAGNGISITAPGSVLINSPAPSTSTTTGAIQVAGGLGVVGNTYIGGDLGVNGSNITTTNTTFNVANTTATTINIGGAANVNIGSTTGTTTLRSATVNVLGSAITTSNTSFGIANSTATSIELGGAANTLNMGANTGTATIRNATVALLGSALTAPATFGLANSVTTALEFAGAATTLNMGATTGTATIRNATVNLLGDLNVNGGDIGTTQTTFTVANTTATTLWLGAGATSNVLIGNASGNTFIRSANTTVNGNFTANGTITETANGQQWAVASQYDIGMNPNQIPLNQYLGSMAFQSADGISVGIATVSGDLSVNSGNVITTSTSFNVANTTATTLWLGGAANVNFGSTTGNTTIRSANTVVTGDLFVNGGDILSTQTTFNIANTTATTLELGGAANVNIGSTTGNTTIRSANTVLTGDLFVNGGDILSTQTTFNIANNTATTLSVGGAATALLLGATTGTMNLRNATVNLLGSALTGPATFALANSVTTSLEIGGAATTLNMGATTGTMNLRNATVNLLGSALTGPATFSVANTTSTTLGIGGAATNLVIGATTGTATIRNATTVITGDLTVSGGDIVGTASLNLANTTTTALEIGGAATTLNMGATTGTMNLRNATVNLLGSALTGPASFSVANTTSTTLGIGGAATSLLIGATTGNTTIRSANLIVSGTLTARYATKVANTATASSVTPNISTYNQYSYTSLDSGITINAPTGTPTDGERLMFRIKDNGTSQTVTWDAIYRIIGTVLPTNTVANKTMYIGCIYNLADTKWDVVAVSRES